MSNDEKLAPVAGPGQAQVLGAEEDIVKRKVEHTIEVRSDEGAEDGKDKESEKVTGSMRDYIVSVPRHNGLSRPQT